MSEVEEQVLDEFPERARRRRWPKLVSVVVLVAVTVGSTAYAVQQRADATNADERAGRLRDAVLVASGFVEALISYDYENLDAQQVAVERYVTDDFRADYTDAFTNDVRDQIVAEKATSTVKVEGVWLTIEDGDEASAIVHALSTIESDGGATANLESYLRVRLVRLNGDWQVDDLTSLGSRDTSAPIPTPDDVDSEDDSDG